MPILPKNQGEQEYAGRVRDGSLPDDISGRDAGICFAFGHSLFRAELCRLLWDI